MKIIKAGFLVSYDYEYLKISLPRVYPYIDEIVLAIDSERKTWAGEYYEIKDEFWTWLKNFDSDGKITLYEDSFFKSDLTPIECDTRERKMLSERMGKCDWYIQIDSDEYFVDFEQFLNQLKSFESSEPTTIHSRVIPLFKTTAKGYLIIDTINESLPFATNFPEYTCARACYTDGHNNVHWNNLVLHQSWARGESEIETKLNNWSHKTDFVTDSYFNLWKAVDEHNFSYLKDFHPLDKTTWSKLLLMKDLDINQLLKISEKAWSDLVQLNFSKGGNQKKRKFWKLW